VRQGVTRAGRPRAAADITASNGTEPPQGDSYGRYPLVLVVEHETSPARRRFPGRRGSSPTQRGTRRQDVVRVGARSSCGRPCTAPSMESRVGRFRPWVRSQQGRRPDHVSETGDTMAASHAGANDAWVAGSVDVWSPRRWTCPLPWLASSSRSGSVAGALTLDGSTSASTSSRNAAARLSATDVVRPASVHSRRPTSSSMGASPWAIVLASSCRNDATCTVTRSTSEPTSRSCSHSTTCGPRRTEAGRGTAAPCPTSNRA